MKLAPTAPPGRSTRKARAFSAEIRELRHQGYTFEAIRVALADAGVHVSHSTVRREVAKTAERVPAIRSVHTTASHRISPQPPGPAAPSWDAPATSVAGVRRLARSAPAKEEAEAFFSAHHNNPLLDIKESS
jgi:hypothetical protein